MNILNTEKLKVVVFDWDGTLVESRTPRLWAVNQIMKEYGLPDWESTRHLQNRTLSFMDNFPNVFGDKAEEAYEKYSLLYKQNVQRMIKVFDGVRETLKLLKEKNIKIAIMSNKQRALLEYENPMLFQDDTFDKIVCGHEAKRDKPFKEHALLALDGLIDFQNINPQTVWIVGDSILDNMCAIATNTLPVRILGKAPHPDMIKNPQDNEKVIYFKSFNDFYLNIDKS